MFEKKIESVNQERIMFVGLISQVCASKQPQTSGSV